MLDIQLSKKIEDFVYAQPRSIQEIAKFIGKSWRTADRYIEEIKSNFGTIETKTFRSGTRGALKIVFWASVEKASNTIFQNKLQEEITKGRKKEDFSAFDIFQHIKAKNKKVTIEKAKEEAETNIDEIADIIKSAKKQIISFTGNLSWINLKDKKNDLFKILENKIAEGVSVKAVGRVDLSSITNIEKLLAMNFKHKKELVEMRHAEQPLRALIIDDKILRIKEIKEPTGKINELNKRTFIFYTIKDSDWIKWAQKIFWNIFNKSIDANKRLEEINRYIRKN